MSSKKMPHNLGHARQVGQNFGIIPALLFGSNLPENPPQFVSDLREFFDPGCDIREVTKSDYRPTRSRWAAAERSRSNSGSVRIGSRSESPRRVFMSANPARSARASSRIASAFAPG